VKAAQWLIGKDPMLLGSDNWPVEVAPNPDPLISLPVHQNLSDGDVDRIISAVREVLGA